MRDLEAATGFESGSIVDHLQYKRSTSAHLDLADVETEPEERLQEGALPVGLAPDSHNLRDRQRLAEGHGGALEPVVGLEPGSRIHVAPPALRRGFRRSGSVGAGDGGGGRHGGGGGGDGKGKREGETKSLNLNFGV